MGKRTPGYICLHARRTSPFSRGGLQKGRPYLMIRASNRGKWLMSTGTPGKTTVARFGNEVPLSLQLLHFSNPPAREHPLRAGHHDADRKSRRGHKESVREGENDEDHRGCQKLLRGKTRSGHAAPLRSWERPRKGGRDKPEAAT